MQYMGGKSRIAKHIARAIEPMIGDRHIYLEPFVGGASMLAVMAPRFPQVYASDTHPDLILFWRTTDRTARTEKARKAAAETYARRRAQKTQ